MKILIGLLLPLSLFAQVKIVDLKVNKIYAPEGFDSNDSSQVIISGVLPDLCHKAPRYKMIKENNDIYLTVQAAYSKDYSNGCEKIELPFLLDVDLGELKTGEYHISMLGVQNRSVKANLKIKQATTSERDDHLYANVGFVEENDANRKIKLMGYHPSSCFEIQKVEVLSNNKDVLSLLPILKRVSRACPSQRVAFEYDLEIPHMEDMARGVLLHVRTMNGGALNHLFQNKMNDRLIELK